MIRIVCVEVDISISAIGGPPETKYRTFDVELVEIEAWLRKPTPYGARAFAGIELLPVDDTLRGGK